MPWLIAIIVSTYDGMRFAILIKMLALVICLLFLALDLSPLQI